MNKKGNKGKFHAPFLIYLASTPHTRKQIIYNGA